MNVTMNTADNSFSFSFDEFEKHTWSVCESFISALKDIVPKDERSLDSDTHEWTIDEKHLEKFQELRITYFDSKDQQNLW